MITTPVNNLLEAIKNQASYNDKDQLEVTVEAWEFDEDDGISDPANFTLVFDNDEDMISYFKTCEPAYVFTTDQAGGEDFPLSLQDRDSKKDFIEGCNRLGVDQTRANFDQDRKTWEEKTKQLVQSDKVEVLRWFNFSDSVNVLKTKDGAFRNFAESLNHLKHFKENYSLDLWDFERLETESDVVIDLISGNKDLVLLFTSSGE